MNLVLTGNSRHFRCIRIQLILASTQFSTDWLFLEFRGCPSILIQKKLLANHVPRWLILGEREI